MVAIALSLMLLTYADVWMIQTSTKIEAFSAIILRHKPRFWRSLYRLFVVYAARFALRQGTVLFDICECSGLKLRIAVGWRLSCSSALLAAAAAPKICRLFIGGRSHETTDEQVYEATGLTCQTVLHHSLELLLLAQIYTAFLVLAQNRSIKQFRLSAPFAARSKRALVDEQSQAVQ
ncbi:hypothetical protein niasHT_012330 [Heterodera trifolii]|uniref:Uncharacterized protein n=1 Tax=Heterodera trifolii TaxID=157864 RepID=A0ABD2LFB3_9BILA